MSAHFTTPTDELLLLAETLGEVKTKADKLEAEFSTQARPLEAATNALSAALSGIKALQFHVLDNNLGALSARVEEMRKAVDEQVGVIALELKKADETNAAKAGQEAEALRSEIAALQAQLGTLGAQFSAQLERVEFSAKEEAKKLQLIPGPAGAAGASLNPRGTFIDGETYNRLDVVSWLGSSYIAAVDGVTEKPSKNSNQWQVLASRGSGGSGGAGDFGSLAGVAQINQGGTGQTTRAAGLNALLPDQAGATQYMLLTDGAGTVSWGAQPVAGLPSQTGNSGKLLTTNGTSASWGTTLTTLSVTNGISANELTCTGGYAVFRGFGGSADTGALYLGQTTNNNFISSNLTTMASYIANTAITSTVAAGFRVLATTASTTTSTGALVVSGGVGVGGQINAGSGTHIFGNAAATAQILVQRITTDPSSIQLNAVSSFANIDFGSQGGGFTFGSIKSNGSEILRIHNGNFAAITPVSGGGLAVGGGLNVSATTASTTTSSGALVVSGGVGVAGAIVAGGALHTTGNGTGGPYLASSANFDFASGQARFYGRGANTSTRATLGFYSTYSDGTGGITLQTFDTSGNATFAGSVQTSAPSGGTAAAWKLGTVATVSPTSPNRTIEVDIGGTIYYIHAKTTNN